MHYFDNEYLKQYIGTGNDVRVFDGSEYLTIISPDDLEHPQVGIGYTEDGEPVRFDYKDVTQTKVGNTVFTIDMLNHEIEKMNNPEEFSDIEDGEGEEAEGDEEGGASVEDDFGGLGGSMGGDIEGGDIEGGDIEGGDIEGGDMDDVGDIEGDDTGGGTGDDFGDDDFGDDVGDAGDDEDSIVVGDAVIHRGDQIINESIKDGVGRYGFFIMCNSDKVSQNVLYETYDPDQRRMVIMTTDLKNVGF